MLIDEPKLYCEHCYELQEHGVPPRCKTAAGCPIEELATNKAVYEACVRFMKARALADKTGVSTRLEEFFAEYETDLDTEIEFEHIWTQYLAQQPEQKDRAKPRKRPYRRT